VRVRRVLLYSALRSGEVVDGVHSYYPNTKKGLPPQSSFHLVDYQGGLAHTQQSMIDQMSALHTPYTPHSSDRTTPAKRQKQEDFIQTLQHIQDLATKALRRPWRPGRWVKTVTELHGHSLSMIML